MTAFVSVRIDEELKHESAKVLAEVGLTVSDVVRMTLRRVVKDRAVPLELKVPNATTRAAMREARRLMKTHSARVRLPRAILRSP